MQWRTNFSILSMGLWITSIVNAAAPTTKPNVLILYLDDMGWQQPGCYGGKLAPTPNMDQLATNGMRFTDGYVSACVCSPSRVGLLTGRYQARSGHDANGEGRGAAGRELLLSETTIGQRMKAAGYTTGIVGKWHVGATTPAFLPIGRGFDVSFGTTGNLGEADGYFYRGADKVPDPPGAPVTSPIFAKEAIHFIEANQDRPWLLYLPFNAVHSPAVASEHVLKRFAHLEKREQSYAALISEADDAIGSILTKLRDLKLEDNTLIFLISDNGGASPISDRGDLRGRKWQLFEGGIRVSWLAQWKGRIPAGQVSNTPVIQLDVLPTALAAAGSTTAADGQLDGVNLLPLLEGKVKQLERDALYWRFGVQYAIRQGDWKLVKPTLEEKPMLFNLTDDRGEQKDLASQQPDRLRSLQAKWDAWNTQMQPPRWEDRRWNTGNLDKPAKRAEAKAKKKAA